MEPRNRFQGIYSASLWRPGGRYDNPIPTRFPAPIDGLKIPALVSLFALVHCPCLSMSTVSSRKNTYCGKSRIYPRHISFTGTSLFLSACKLVFYWNRRLAKLPTLVQCYSSYGLKNVGGRQEPGYVSICIIFPRYTVRNLLSLHIVNISYYYSLPYKRIVRNML